MLTIIGFGWLTASLVLVALYPTTKWIYQRRQRKLKAELYRIIREGRKAQWHAKQP